MLGRPILFAALIAARPAAAQLRSVTVEPPARDYGYFAGDLLTSTVRLTAAPGTTIDAATLPPPGTVTDSLELRGRALTSRHQPGAEIFTLRLTYQTFFAPLEALRQAVPGFEVALTDHGQRRIAAVPGFSVTVSPFRHDLQPPTDPAAIRPAPPPAAPSAVGGLWLLAAGVSLAAIGAAGLLAERFARPAPPFAAAARRIRALGDSDPRTALRTLHRAFDAAAGHRLLADDLDTFLASRPACQPLRADIAAFFETSRAVFFGAGAPAGTIALDRLSRALARAERAG